MSRVGKQPISIPNDVEISIKDNVVEVEGPKGTLDFEVRPELKVEKEEGELLVKPEQDTKQTKALWGTTRTRIANMVQGVQEGFEKELEIQGLGYKATVKKDKLELEVGFSHPVELDKPEGIEFEVNEDQDEIKISGIDKNKVGQIAAEIRNIKPPEPYKGKGIRYKGEEIERKEGKRAVGAEGGPGGAA
ncbi:MAG: 50S ribosomal protein L6 [Candidatus Paceibacterota bacterium]